MTNEEKIEFAEECGLAFCGEYYKNGEPIFLGDNKAWSKFDDGGN